MLLSAIFALIIATTFAHAGAIQERLRWSPTHALSAGDRVSQKFCFVGHVRNDTKKWTLSLVEDQSFGRKVNLRTKFTRMNAQCFRAKFTVPLTVVNGKYRFRLSRLRPWWFRRYYDQSGVFKVSERMRPEVQWGLKALSCDVLISRLPELARKRPENLNRFKKHLEEIDRRGFFTEYDAYAEVLKEKMTAALQSAVEAAASAENTKIVNYLYDVEGKTRPSLLTGENGCNAILSLIQHGDHVEVIRNISKHHASDPEFHNCVNEALFRATDAQRAQIVQYLTSGNTDAEPSTTGSRYSLGS